MKDLHTNLFIIISISSLCVILFVAIRGVLKITKTKNYECSKM